MEEPTPRPPLRTRLAAFVPDFRDGVALVGLALMGVGTWMIYPPAALLLVGAALLLVGICGVPKWDS